jgi:uncharacterized membrane protein
MQDCVLKKQALTPEFPPAFTQFTATLLPCHVLPREAVGALLFNIAGLIYLSVIVFFAFGVDALAALWSFDVALCFVVYRWKFAPRQLSEHVELTDGNLSVTRVHPSGKVENWDFDPYWVRFEHQRCQGKRDELRLTSHGNALVFGVFLSDHEKASFAVALSAALARQRGQLPVCASE